MTPAENYFDSARMGFFCCCFFWSVRLLEYFFPPHLCADPSGFEQNIAVVLEVFKIELARSPQRRGNTAVI